MLRWPKNLDISLEKYKLEYCVIGDQGSTGNYLDAQSKFFAAQYQSKSAEIMLKEITASITFCKILLPFTIKAGNG